MNTAKNALKFFLTSKHSVILMTISILVWLNIAFVADFGDELENFTGGWLVFNGLVPYRDFFFHHAPLPYFVGAIPYFFSGYPWILLRMIVFLWYLGSGIYVLAHVRRQFRIVVGMSWITLAVAAPLFHAQMFLAESFLSITLVALILLMGHCLLYSTASLEPIIAYWFVGGFICLWSTIVSLPPIGWIGIGLIALQIHREKHVGSLWAYKKYLLLFLGAHAVVMGYFVLARSLTDAYWAIVQYNFDYYFPLRLADKPSQAALGYPIAVVYNFAVEVSSQLKVVADASLVALQTAYGLSKSWIMGEAFNMNQLGVLWSEWWQRFFTLPSIGVQSSILVILWLFLRKKPLFGLWWLVLVLVSRNRDNEIFKLAPYYLVIATSLVVLTVATWRKRQKLSAFLFFCYASFFVASFVPKYIDVAKSRLPMVSRERVETSRLISEGLTSSSQPVYILGGDPSYYLLSRRLPAHRYFYYHPWFHGAQPMREEVISFLNSNVEYPVVLASELDGSDLSFAEELQVLVRQKYVNVGGGVYLPMNTTRNN
jgi:hypothetical protein